jgi:hypothetical protein
LSPTTTTSTTTTAMITTEDDQLRIEYPDIIYDPSTPTTHHGYNQPLVYFERCILLSSSINKHCENNPQLRQQLIDYKIINEQKQQSLLHNLLSALFDQKACSSPL